MIEPFNVDGITVDKAKVLELRESVILLRDGAIKSGNLDWAFSISLIIAFMHQLAERME